MIAALPAHHETARAGSVVATVAYQQWSPRNDSRYYVRLSVVRDGRKVFDAVVPKLPGSSDGNQPLGVWPKGHTITVRDLDRDGEPEIVLDFYWGGAHCCYWSRIYRWNGTTYVQRAHVWGDPGYALSGASFVTGDDRFAYAFSSYAFSAFPLEILDYRNGMLVDVTRSHRGQLLTDARRLLRDLRQIVRSHGETRGVLAAWVADQCLLGRSTYAFQWLAARPGLYAGAGPTAQDYRAALRRFLRRTGYLRYARSTRSACAAGSSRSRWSR